LTLCDTVGEIMDAGGQVGGAVGAARRLDQPDGQIFWGHGLDWSTGFMWRRK
jgi:hypothetical protein